MASAKKWRNESLQERAQWANEYSATHEVRQKDLGDPVTESAYNPIITNPKLRERSNWADAFVRKQSTPRTDAKFKQITQKANDLASELNSFGATGYQNPMQAYDNLRTYTNKISELRKELADSRKTDSSASWARQHDQVEQSLEEMLKYVSAANGQNATYRSQQEMAKDIVDSLSADKDTDADRSKQDWTPANLAQEQATLQERELPIQQQRRAAMNADEQRAILADARRGDTETRPDVANWANRRVQELQAEGDEEGARRALEYWQPVLQQWQAEGSRGDKLQADLDAHNRLATQAQAKKLNASGGSEALYEAAETPENVQAQIDAYMKEFRETGDRNAYYKAESLKAEQEQTTRQLKRAGDEAAQQEALQPYYDLAQEADFAQWAEKGRTANKHSPLLLSAWERVNFRDQFTAEDAERGKAFREGLEKATGVSDAPYSSNKYAFLTDEERSIYNYLYAKQGEQEANAFLSALDRDLNARHMEAWNQLMQETANQNKMIGTAANLISPFVKPVGAVATAVQSAANAWTSPVTGRSDTLDPNSPWFIGSRLDEATRAGLTQDMNETGKFLTDTALSIGQFLPQLALPKSVSLAMMGSSAMGDTAQDVLARGGTQDQALALGTISGLAEVAMEKIGIDRILNGKGAGKESFRRMVAQAMASEGMEEGATELVNVVADSLFMGDLSSAAQLKQQYMEAGLTEAEANSRVIAELAKQVGLAAAGGVLSGGFFDTAIKGPGYLRQGANGVKAARNLDMMQGIKGDTGTAGMPRNRADTFSSTAIPDSELAFGDQTSAVRADMPMQNESVAQAQQPIQNESPIQNETTPAIAATAAETATPGRTLLQPETNGEQGENRLGYWENAFTGTQQSYDTVPATSNNKRLQNKADAALKEDVSRILGIPDSNGKEAARIIRSLREYALNGDVDANLRNQAFDLLYEQARVQKEPTGPEKNMLREMRDMRLKATDGLRAEFSSDEQYKLAGKGLKLSKDGEIPVYIAYQALNETYGEAYFPSKIVTQSEQLQHMSDMLEALKPREMTMAEAYGSDEPGLREALRNEFDQALDGYLQRMDYLGQVRAEEYAAQADAQEQAQAKPLDVAEATELYRRRDQAQRAAAEVRRDNPLTAEDKKSAEAIIAGGMQLDQLRPGQNTEAIARWVEAETASRNAAKAVVDYKRSTRAPHYQLADRLTQNVTKWKDAKSGLSLWTTTPERIVRRIAGDADGQAINDEILWPQRQNEAAKNRYTKQVFDEVRALKLTKKESALVQAIGEGRLDEPLQNNRHKFTDAEIAKAQKAVPVFRKIYSDLYQKVSDAYVRNGYEPLGHIEDYFPHFNDANDPLTKMCAALGFRIDTGNLPTDIAGLTETYKPGRKWFANAMHRLTDKTTFDALEGLQRYMQGGAADVIFHTEDIQRLRALETMIREKSANEGLRQQLEAIRNNPDLDPETIDAQISALLEANRKGVQLSHFVTWLRDYTNIFAGKKPSDDRWMEHKIGRVAYSAAKSFNSRVAKNMVGANIASSLTNFVALGQGAADVPTKHVLRGLKDMVASAIQDDGFANQSTFLTNRFDVKNISNSVWDKIDNASMALMSLTDHITAETIVRAKYYEGIEQGLTHDQAMRRADEYTAAVFADRSKGALPTAFASGNPLLKPFTMFQTEVKNQLDYLRKDLPKNLRGKGVSHALQVIGKLVLGNWLFNELYEYLFGRRPAPDVIGYANEIHGHFTGKKLPNMVDLIVNGKDNQSSKAKKYEGWEAFVQSGRTLAEDVPFLGSLLGGGRVPISSALPESITDLSSMERYLKDGSWLNLLMPTGGSQVRKMLRGGQDVYEGGQYFTNDDGERQLQYSLEDGWDTWMRAIIGGPSAQRNAQQYYTEGRKPLSADSTTAYEFLVSGGMQRKKAEELIREIDQIEGDKDEDGNAIPNSRKEKVRNFLLENKDLNYAEKERAYAAVFPEKEKTDEEKEAAQEKATKADDGQDAVEKKDGWELYVPAFAHDWSDKKLAVVNDYDIPYETVDAFSKFCYETHSDEDKDGRFIKDSRAKKIKQYLMEQTELTEKQRKALFRLEYKGNDYFDSLK